MAADKSKRVFFERLTLGLINALEKHTGVCDVKLTERASVDKAAVSNWEQDCSCLLPADMRQFYQTSNGLCLTWNLKMNDSKIPLGHLEVNSLDKLCRLGGPAQRSSGTQKPSLADIEDSGDEEDKGIEGLSPPRFNHHSRIFEIEACKEYGRVCLVYRNTKPGVPAQKAEIWFLDRALRWHYLADTFLNYFRLMMTYMGLPQWQYAFTDIGISPQAKQWYKLVCPVRLGLEESIDIGTMEATSTDKTIAKTTTNQLDANRVFRGKEKKKSSQAQNAQTTKKRQQLTSAKSQPSTIGRSASAGLQSKVNR